jgi:hypothetical protein
MCYLIHCHIGDQKFYPESMKLWNNNEGGGGETSGSVEDCVNFLNYFPTISFDYSSACDSYDEYAGHVDVLKFAEK